MEKNFEMELQEISIISISKERFLKITMVSFLFLIVFFVYNYIDLFLATASSLGKIVVNYVFLILMVIGYFVFLKTLEKCQKQYKMNFVEIYKKYNKI